MTRKGKAAAVAPTPAAKKGSKKDKTKPAIVLLSPAAASFDQFKDFEARGEAFREMVAALPGKHLDTFDAADIFPGGGSAE